MIRHEGKSTHRLKDNPLEAAFADEWTKQNNPSHSGSGTLAYLMGDGTHPGVVSDRDAMIAATVIQWLGSPVGQRFLIEVLSSRRAIPWYRDFRQELDEQKLRQG